MVRSRLLLLVVCILFTSPALAKGKGCNTSADVGGTYFTLDVAGSAFAQFQGAAPDLQQVAHATLHWQHNAFYARHPTFGLVSMVARPTSTARLLSTDGQPPLFPAHSVHELYLDVRLDGLTQEYYNPSPVRVVSSQPASSFADMMDASYWLESAVEFVTKDTGAPGFTMTSGAVDVKHENRDGIVVQRGPWTLQQGELIANFRIGSTLSVPVEVVWDVATSGGFALLSTGTLPDPRLLGNAHAVVLAPGEPVDVQVRVDVDSLQAFDGVFVGATTLDGSRIIGAASLTGDEIKAALEGQSSSAEP